MDSYTDVSTQCCGRGRMSCGASFGNGCGSYTNPDYPDMNAFPWDSWGSNPALSYPTPAAPATKPANMSCPSTEPEKLTYTLTHFLYNDKQTNIINSLNK